MVKSKIGAILAGRATPKWLLRRVSGTLGRKSIQAPAMRPRLAR